MATQPPDEESDEDLVHRIAVDRDEAALTLLARRATPRAMGFLKRKYSGRMRDPEMRQAVTDAFFNVWRFADRFAPSEGDFGSWFIRIVQNAAQSILRGEKKHVAKELEFDPVYDPADPDEEDGDLPSGNPGGMTRVLLIAIRKGTICATRRCAVAVAG